MILYLIAYDWEKELLAGECIKICKIYFHIAIYFMRFSYSKSLSKTSINDMQRKAIFMNEGQVYRLKERSDPSMFTLFMYLGDGLGYDSYIKFLEDNKRNEFLGNISVIEKKGSEAIITIDDNIISNAVPFITTINNLIVILKEYKRLELLGVDKIEIALDDDQVTVNGSWEG